MFFRKYLYCAEVRGESRAVQFVGLFAVISLGDKNEAMAGAEVGECRVDVRQKLDLLIGDGLGEAFDAPVLLVGKRGVSQLFEAGDQRTAKAVQAIAVGENSIVLDTVEVFADLFCGVDAVIKVRDEAGDRALKVDVVFPESVVGVDQQCLARVSGNDPGRLGGLV